MTRRIIIAIAGMSLFCGLAVAQAATPAASRLTPVSDLDAKASTATPERVAYYGYPAFNSANTAANVQVGLAGIAIGTNGTVSQAAVAQAGGIGSVGVAAASSQGYFGGRGLGYHGGPRSIAMNDAPSASQADILFDN